MIVSLSKLHVVLIHTRLVVEALAEGSESTTGEQDDPFELLIKEEVIEAPERTVFTERVGGKVWIVAVDVAFEKVYLLIE